MSAKLSEILAVVGTVDPDAYVTGTSLTDAIDMEDHEQVIFTVMVGELGSSATVDFYVMESTASGGTYTRLSGKSITQLTDAGTDDDKQAIVVVKASELTSGYSFLKGSLRIGAADSDAAVIAQATSRFSDAVTSTSFGDLASVDEIVV